MQLRREYYSFENSRAHQGFQTSPNLNCTYARTSLKAFVKGQVNVGFLLSESSKELFLWKRDTYLVLNAQWRSREKRNKFLAPAGTSRTERSDYGFFLVPERRIQLPGSLCFLGSVEESRSDFSSRRLFKPVVSAH